MRNLKILLAALLMAACSSVWPQVAINMDESPAHGSAMLDVTSTERGVLIPRMTTAQMLGIQSPAPGLSLYNTDSNNYSFWNGAQWITLGSGFDTDWYINGNNLYSGQSGNVGIGTMNPDRKLHVVSAESSWGLARFQNENPGQNEASIAFVEGSDAVASNFWVMGVGLFSQTGDFIISRGIERFKLDYNGNLGIGTESIDGDLGLLTKTKNGGSVDAFSHKVTIANLSDDNVLRLVGPDGSWGHGARLNFGDSDYAYIDEDEDDKLDIHASRVAFSGGYVGIATSTPSANLDVLGSTKFGHTGTPFFEIKQLTGTTPMGSTSTQIAYPSGWNQSNTRVICLEVRYYLEGYYYIGIGHPTLQVFYTMSSSAIIIAYPAGSGNQPYRLVLMKF
ncbi:MAG: hypothetical protein IH598_16780 [Bacteroidales bacterium]|nr:hypothetical protein [Bacteroidales bacterium]